ncbi:hypothetical protein AAG570_003836 [Ranatra chinensis]|uniref:ELP1 first N-terminal beta-propeller domain-containing protein n=1 Tax=Ranatra chinensis TaxID=642074 RepID=A0ABD0Y2C7_9HEMI
MKNIKPSLVLTQFYPELDNLEFVVLGNLDRGEVNFCDSDLTQKTGYLYALKEGLVYELSLTKEHYNLIFDLREYYGREDLPKVVDFSYNYITNSLVLAIEDGDLLVYYFDQDAKNFCCACNVELGLRALEWSPDQENLVLSVGDDNCLLVMSSSFCVLNEIFLEESSEGEQKLMSVGWGRKETQFHGSEGKKAATAPLPDLSALSVADSCGLTVTWRGDSALFAVGYMCTQSKARRIKIFSKEGALQCASEDLPGLEEPMAWRPSGNLIGLVQSLPSKYVIAFMEKNGLKHGEFIIPQNIKVDLQLFFSVDKLIWNADSSILGILASDKTSGEESLMLWTTGNYHWYLKQKIVLESTPVSIFLVQL